jgi:hypothetical protein
MAKDRSLREPGVTRFPKMSATKRRFIHAGADRHVRALEDKRKERKAYSRWMRLQQTANSCFEKDKMSPRWMQTFMKGHWNITKHVNVKRGTCLIACQSCFDGLFVHRTLPYRTHAYSPTIGESCKQKEMSCVTQLVWQF